MTRQHFGVQSLGQPADLAGRGRPVDGPLQQCTHAPRAHAIGTRRVRPNARYVTGLLRCNERPRHSTRKRRAADQAPGLPTASFARTRHHMSARARLDVEKIEPVVV
jgi:hypothetical protein